MKFIDQHKHEFGVEPICRTLTAAGTLIAPSTYYESAQVLCRYFVGAGSRVGAS
ncbi:hypothetical protein PQI65_01295 [Brachybacterium paraconglomeratum]